MKLYYSPGVCSLSPHIVAREADIPLDLVKVDLQTHKTADGADYYRINPRGHVPALELDNGTLLREGAAIVQFLADRAPASRLAPSPVLCVFRSTLTRSSGMSASRATMCGESEQTPGE